MSDAPASPRIDGDAHEFLLRLLDTPAPSGFEAPAADLIRDYASAWADDIHVDTIGNVHVTVNPGAAHTVCVTGHIDEIGLIVTRIEESGLLRFEGIGGWDASVPVGQRVRVLTRDGVVLGTVGQPAPHQMKDRTKAPKLDALWIDIGVADGDEAKAQVRIGDPVVLDTVPHEFPNRRLMARALDDRIGAFIALEVARAAKGSDVQVVALCATREENGHDGAQPGAFAVDPDEAIAVDVTYTTDVPGDHAEEIELGKGPVVGFGASVTRIGRQLVDIAEAAGIDVQISASGRYTGTDADIFWKSRDGVPVGAVYVATRYLHSPSELIALEDAEASIDLIHRWVVRSRKA